VRRKVVPALVWFRWTLIRNFFDFSRTIASPARPETSVIIGWWRPGPEDERCPLCSSIPALSSRDISPSLTAPRHLLKINPAPSSATMISTLSVLLEDRKVDGCRTGFLFLSPFRRLDAMVNTVSYQVDSGSFISSKIRRSVSISPRRFASLHLYRSHGTSRAPAWGKIRAT